MPAPVCHFSIERTVDNEDLGVSLCYYQLHLPHRTANKFLGKHWIFTRDKNISIIFRFLTPMFGTAGTILAVPLSGPGALTSQP